MQMNIRRVRSKQLGFWESLLGAAGALTGSGAGAAGGMPGTSVSPTIQTAINPQISPNFQQQFQPQNSAMTAGTQQIAPSSMTAPNTPDSAGYAAPAPSYSVPATYPPQSALSPTYASGGETGGFTLQKAIPWIIGGVGIAFAVKYLRK